MISYPYTGKHVLERSTIMLLAGFCWQTVSPLAEIDGSPDVPACAVMRNVGAIILVSAAPCVIIAALTGEAIAANAAGSPGARR